MRLSSAALFFVVWFCAAAFSQAATGDSQLMPSQRGGQPFALLDQSKWTDARLGFTERTTADLPALLREALAKTGEFGAIGGAREQLEETVSLARFDLNGDGSPEYFVRCPAESGNGGSCYMVFQLQKKGYVRIVDIFGQGFSLGRRANGYYTIHSESRVGPGSRHGNVLRYARGAYHLQTIPWKVDEQGDWVRKDRR